jgi:hypothetical protein
MPRPYRPALTALALLLLAAPAAAYHHKEVVGMAALEARSDADKVALSDVLYVVITVEGSKDLQVETPCRPGAGWDVVASAALAPKAGEDGRYRWRQTFTLAPTAPGEQRLELTPLVYRDGEAEAQTVTWKPLTIAVETRIKDADPKQARDITTPEEPPPGPPALEFPWLWITLPLALVVGLAGLWLVLRRRPRPRAVTPGQRALRECDRLAAMKLPDKGHGKSFVALLTGILRRYLERGFDLPARRQTTAELLRAIDGRTDLADESKKWLHAFFAQADLVKFAAAEISAERCEALVEEVRQFLFIHEGHEGTRRKKE